MFVIPLLTFFPILTWQDSEPEWEQVRDRIIQFSSEEQAAFLLKVEEAILALEHPLAKAWGNLKSHSAKFTKLKPREERWYSAKQYAPALKLRTKIYKAKSPGWKRVGRQFFGKSLPPSFDLGVQWDYGRNGILNPKGTPAIPPVDAIHHFWQGRLANQSHWVAVTAGILDHDSNMDSVADYFSHCYRDRAGKVYPGMSLGDVWGSGEEIEVSDAEAVAFMQLILRDDGIKSPIPKRLHDGIYSIIKDSYAEWRDYQQIRDGLAQRFLSPAETPDGVLSSLGPTFDIAWELTDNKPKVMREFLKLHPTRKKFLAEIARLKKQTQKEGRNISAEAKLRANFAALITATTRKVLQDEWLMGIRTR